MKEWPPLVVCFFLAAESQTFHRDVCIVVQALDSLCAVDRKEPSQTVLPEDETPTLPVGLRLEDIFLPQTECLNSRPVIQDQESMGEKKQ